VVVAQDPVAAGEGVVGELAGLFILPRLPQRDGKDGRPSSGCGDGDNYSHVARLSEARRCRDIRSRTV
jgi:hypothetical protein